MALPTRASVGSQGICNDGWTVVKMKRTLSSSQFTAYWSLTAVIDPL